MKSFPFLVFLFTLLLSVLVRAAGDPVILDETGIKNLGLETVIAEETTFEKTLFTLGRIEAVPGRTAVVSSRIAGRLVDLKVTTGDEVAAGAEVARVESRQPGDPPPVIPLRAPIGGVVMSLSSRLGDPVEPDRALLEIADLGEVHALIAVPEYQAGALAPGTKAHLRVPAAGSEPFTGELLRFAPNADREHGTIEAVIRLANPEGRLRPGMRAECSLILATRENVLSVPREAVQGSGSSRYVFVRHFELPTAFERAPVEIGERLGERVEIVGGIFPADEVVTRGAYALAFAGPGSVSLKEALDAAHGHSHNEDGSEITGDHAEGEHDHDHNHGIEEGSLDPLTLFLAIACGVLLLLILASPLLFRRPAKPDPAC